MTEHAHRPTVDLADPVLGAGNVTAELVPNDLLPWHHHVSGAALHVDSHPLATLHNTAWWQSTLSYQTPGVGFVGARLGVYVTTAAGVWLVQWFLDRRSDYPIDQPHVDGVAAGPAVDRYTSGAMQLFVHSHTVTLTRGEHLFELVTTGKNPASSNSTHVFSGLGLTRLS